MAEEARDGRDLVVRDKESKKADTDQKVDDVGSNCDLLEDEEEAIRCKVKACFRDSSLCY